MRNISGKEEYKKYIKIIVSLVLFSSILFLFDPVSKNYTKNIINRKNIVGWIKSDNKALGEVTNINAEVSVSDGGYTFKVEEAKLGENGLIITGSISGPELTYKDGVFPADVEIVPKDFKERSTAEGGGNRFNGSGDTYTFKVEEKYKPGEVESFLAKGQQYITLDVMIYRRDDSDGVTLARKVQEEDLDKRDYRVYWRESDKPIKEFKSIDVPYSYK